MNTAVSTGCCAHSLLKRYSWVHETVLRTTRGPITPRSHPLADYLLWGYMKERVYQDNPVTIERLKQNIRREIRRIPRDMLENNFNVTVAAMIQQRGGGLDRVCCELIV